MVAPLEKLQGQFRFHILLRGDAIMRLSRLVSKTLDKLPMPEDVTVTVDCRSLPVAVDVDLASGKLLLSLTFCW